MKDAILFICVLSLFGSCADMWGTAQTESERTVRDMVRAECLR